MNYLTKAMRKTVLFFLINLFSVTFVYAQLAVDVGGIISSSKNTPFWLESNRFGMYSSEGTQLYSRIQYHNLFSPNNTFTIRYGADLIARPGKNSTINVNQGYVAIKAIGIEFSAGRFHNTSPTHNEEIGIGSLGVSRNASPIPQLRLSLPNWLSIPFTNHFIQIKGHFSHGWLGSNRYTENVLLHEKVGYIRFGGHLPVNLYGGIAHYVKWGGNHPKYGDIPHRWSDFKSVVFALGGDELTPGPEQAYILGDHLGALDAGLLIELPETNVTIYRQFPIETKDNLKLKSLEDALTGVSFQFSEESTIPLIQFVYEFLYTKYQDGPRKPNIIDGFNCAEEQDPTICRDFYGGNEDYYNHGLYRTGWAYNFRTIGNPLFITNKENMGIVNNRIIGHHIGFTAATRAIEWTGKATFSRNYGKYCDNRIPDIGENEQFGIECENIVNTVKGYSLNQWSFFAGMNLPLRFIENQDLRLRMEFAFDNGSLVGDQAGALIGLQWKL